MPVKPEREPESGTRLTAREIHQNIAEPGAEELTRPAGALLLSAVAAGLVIGFSFLAGGFAASLVSPERQNAAAAVVYPLGFIFVILARSELFTEQTLQPVLPLLERRDRRTFRQLLRRWGLLLAGNLAGTLAFAAVIARAPVVDPALDPHLASLAHAGVEGSFGRVFLQAIFAGWLIALLAWLLGATHATGAQIALIWLSTAPIGALGFKHSIVGSVEGFYLMVEGARPVGSVLGEFLVPAVLGNAVGGVLLVALLNYGQVAAEERARLPNDAGE